MRARGPWQVALFATGCLSTPPGSLAPPDDAGACAAADWADAAAPQPPDAVGNVLSLDFEEGPTAYTFHDRSGRRRDAARLIGGTNSGKHGKAMVSSTNSFALVADDGFELGRQLTIAAWVNLDALGASAVISDYDGDSAEYDLHIDNMGRLVFLTNRGGIDTSLVGTPLITVGTWFHVAMTWSDDTVTLYVDGANDVSVDSFTNPPVAHEVPFTIGRRPDGGAKLAGRIDDLRVWDRALSLAEIDEFMQLGDPGQTCGDGVIEQVESCERGDPCCIECQQSNEGCGAAGCGEDGVCVTDCARPTRGLVALYRFDEGEGPLLHDVSGVEPPLDLAMEPENQLRWTADGVELTGATVSSVATADKVIDSIVESNEFTFDVWLTPGDQTANELVRLVSLESGARDFLLGIWNASYLARFGVDTVASSGHPSLEAFERVKLGRQTHLVLTRSDDGTRRLYVDGELRDQSRAPGELAWDAARLLLGDAPGEVENFIGTLHRVAIHSVALDPFEVAASYHGGPR